MGTPVSTANIPRNSRRRNVFLSRLPGLRKPVCPAGVKKLRGDGLSLPCGSRSPAGRSPACEETIGVRCGGGCPLAAQPAAR